MVSLQGTLIAPRAIEWLASAKEPRIHSRYRQSVNLIDPEHGLFSVVLTGLGSSPFGVVAQAREASFEGFEALELHTPVAVDGRHLRFGDFEVETENAREWEPRLDWHRFGESLSESRTALLSELLEQHAPLNSFAPLASEKDTGERALVPLETERALRGAGEGESVQSIALRAAAGPAQQLRDGLAAGDISAVVQSAEGLAGLGGGVTPSGDDYLQGAMHALWSKLEGDRAELLADAIAEAAIHRTNAISAAWLSAASRGEAGDDWHWLAHALAEDDNIEQACIGLIHRGHTSGADAMAGFLLAIEALS